MTHTWDCKKYNKIIYFRPIFPGSFNAGIDGVNRMHPKIWEIRFNIWVFWKKNIASKLYRYFFWWI